MSDAVGRIPICGSCDRPAWPAVHLPNSAMCFDCVNFDGLLFKDDEIPRP